MQKSSSGQLTQAPYTLVEFTNSFKSTSVITRTSVSTSTSVDTNTRKKPYKNSVITLQQKNKKNLTSQLITKAKSQSQEETEQASSVNIRKLRFTPSLGLLNLNNKRCKTSQVLTPVRELKLTQVVSSIYGLAQSRLVLRYLQLTLGLRPALELLSTEQHTQHVQQEEMQMQAPCESTPETAKLHIVPNKPLEVNKHTQALSYTKHILYYY